MTGTHEFKIPTMLTIKETAKLFKANGISETYIRRGVNSGKIPHVYAGRKILVNVDRFIDYLNDGE